MRAALMMRTDGPAGLEVAEADEPVAEEGQVVVDVRAVGLSFPDLLLSRGEYQIRPETPFPIGADFCGVVREDVPGHGLAAGDRVAGVVPFGAAVERLAVDPSRLLPVPPQLDDAEAAALPLAFLTAHFALVERGRASLGSRVLVDGATGGVGAAAVQVARALGCRVVALVRSAEDVERVRALGADEVLVDPAAARIREAAGGGIDVALDVVGSDALVLESLRSLAEGGRLIVLGFAGGSIPAIKANRLLLGNTDVRGASWGPYSRAHPGFAREQWRDIVQWLADGRIAPPRTRVHPLADAAAALAAVGRDGVRGRVVLAV